MTYGCFLFWTYYLSSSPCAFSSVNAIRAPLLDTAKIWIVPLSEEHAIQFDNLSKEIEKISALSAPRRTSYIGEPSSVEKRRIKVPLSLAVAKIEPEKFKAIFDNDEVWASITCEWFFSYIVTLTWPFYLSGVAKTEMLLSALKAQRPFGFMHVSIASIKRRSAKL